MPAWIRLLRPALAPTAAADVIAGYAILCSIMDARPVPWALAFATLAGVLFYSSGMVLNDCFDAQRDRPWHPDRPIPSGRISLRVAVLIGTALAGAGLLAAMASDAAGGGSATALAGMLFYSVLLYDGALKRFPIPGAAALGLCRMLNMQLGMAAHADFRHLTAVFDTWTHWGGLKLLLPSVLIGLFAAALTYVSTREERGARRIDLIAVAVVWGAVLLAGGALAVGRWPWARGLCFVLAAAGLAAYVSKAWLSGSGADVRKLVGVGLMALPMLDFAFTLGLGDRGGAGGVVPIWPLTAAVGVCALWTMARGLKKSLT